MPSSSAEASDGLFDAFAIVYKDALPKTLELPSDGRHSELHFYQREVNGTLEPPLSVAWLIGTSSISRAPR